MVVAEVVRRSPFDFIQTRINQKRVYLELFGLSLLVLAIVAIRLNVREDLHVYGYTAVGVIYTFLIFSDLKYGIAALIVAIGVSPDSVIYSNVRLEDYLFPPLLVIWWFKRLADGTQLEGSPINKNIKFYLFVILIATVKGNYLGTVYGLNLSLAYCYKYIEYFLMFYFILQTIKKKEDIVLLLIVTFTTCAVVAYISYTNRADKLVEGTEFVRASGPEGETPNILGGYYMMNMMLAFALMFSIKQYLYKLMLLAFLAGVGAPLLYTYSRTSFASLIIGLVITSLFIDLRFFLFLFIFAFFAPLLFPLETFVDQSFIDRYETILDVFGGDEDGKKTPSSWEARNVGWYIHFKRTWDQYPLLGKGVGSVTLGIDNSYIKKYVETGVLGSYAFILLIYRIARVTYQNIKEIKDIFLKTYCIGYFGILAGFLVHAVGVSSFSAIRTAEPFWIFTGVMAATGIIWRHQKELLEEENLDRSSLSFRR